MIHDSYEVAPSLIWDAIRAMFSALDRVTYGLLGLMYQLFFNVASSDILAGDTIMKFYSRVQLILGVFMMFQLAMIILKGIVNPDSFTDSKNGIGNLIMRICVALFLLTSLVPINIPSPQNEYEKQLNNHGLLFGTLYSLQHRILENNTLGRLILGNSGESDNYVSTSGNYSASLEKSSRIFTSTILKTFYRINLLPDDQLSDRCKKADDPARINECRMCQSGIDHVIETYQKLDVDPDEIISMVNETCTSNSNIVVKLFKYAAGTNRYALTYSWLLSSVTAIVFTFILISFTIDIAVRAIKLAILRLIAPIPIISYMDPKGSKDNAFNSWVKVLTSTYIDLFVRLAIVYFVLFLIEEIIVEGIIIPEDTGGVMKAFTYVAIFIGMFMFARQAPKFLKQVLGLKDSDFKLFGGMAAAVGFAGSVGSAAANWRASDEEQRALGHGTGRRLLTNAGSAIVGGIAGGAIGMDAAGKKDATVGSVLKAQAARNAKRSDHSTLPGRIGDSAYGLITGRSLATRDQSQLDTANKAFDELKKLKTTAEEEALKQQNYYGAYNGNNYNFQALSAALSRARSSGATTFDVQDSNGISHTLTTDDLDENVMNKIKESQTTNYLRDQVNGVGTRNGTLMNQYDLAHKAVQVAGYDRAGSYRNPQTNVVTTYAAFDGTDFSSIKQTMGRAKDISTGNSTSMQTIMHRANKQNNKNN